MVMVVEMCQQGKCMFLIDGYVTLDGDCQDNDANLNPLIRTEMGNPVVKLRL